MLWECYDYMFSVPRINISAIFCVEREMIKGKSEGKIQKTESKTILIE